MAVALLTVLYALLAWLVIWIPLARSRADVPASIDVPGPSSPTHF